MLNQLNFMDTTEETKVEGAEGEVVETPATDMPVEEAPEEETVA